MSVADLIPPQYRLLAELAIAAAALAGMFALGHHGGHASGYAKGHAEAVAVKAQWDAEKLQAQQAAITAQEQAATETQRRLTAAQEQDHEDRIHEQRRADGVVDLSARDQRLQQLADSAAHSCGVSAASNPAAPVVSQAASSPSDLSAYVRRRMGEAARGVVEYADAAGDAAESCAARYDALSK